MLKPTAKLNLQFLAGVSAGVNCKCIWLYALVISFDK